MEKEDALFTLGLLDTPKISKTDLKKVYWALAKELHPDRGGDAEQFKKVTAAYEFCLERVEVLTDEVPELEYTTDGYAFISLGRGLGRHDVMGVKICEDCDGKGYTSQIAESFDGVEYCSCRTGFVFVKCGKCRGYGKIMGKICTACHGRGKWRDVCEKCLGKGWNYIQSKKQLQTFRCSACEGKGEIELFNPVIPRSAILGGSRR